MRLGLPGEEEPFVVVSEDTVVPVGDLVDDFDENFFGGGGLAFLGPVVGRRIAQGKVEPVGQRRIGAPIARPHQILAIGLNYVDHATETTQAPPTEPIVFTKAPNCMVGPYDDVVLPAGATELDYEVELGVVIARRASSLTTRAEATATIAGYVVSNDVSERSWQLQRGGQWMKGKSAPTFNPCGPYLVTPDELPEPLVIPLWTDVNGEQRQRASTADMIFDPLFLIQYLSQFVTLEPGDLVNTGTPAGVAMGMTPPRYLQAGDVVELGIEHLGQQRQRIIEWSARPTETGRTRPRLRTDRAAV